MWKEEKISEKEKTYIPTDAQWQIPLYVMLQCEGSLHLL